MANGYDPDRGLVMVPLDLNNEVVRPLERLGDEVARLDEKIQNHINAHTEERAEAAVKREKRKRILKWLLTTGGTVTASSLVYALQQIVT